MNIGLFGLSGVGKTYLASKLTEERADLVLTRASKLINEGNQEIRYDHLNKANVDTNQLALLKGFELFKKNNQNKNILIELHNLIETPQGVVPIEDYVFNELKLDAVCFIYKTPKDIFNQRKLDKQRKRSAASEVEIESYQFQALELFKSCFNQLDPSKVCILKSPTDADIGKFIDNIT